MKRTFVKFAVAGGLAVSMASGAAQAAGGPTDQDILKDAETPGDILTYGMGTQGQRQSGGGQPQGQSGGQPTMTAKFIPVQTGLRDGERIEITGGIDDGARVITTGAGALRDGDRIVAARGDGRGERAGGGNTR